MAVLDGIWEMKKSLRILIADDKPRMLDYLQVMLPPLGHQVVATATDGKQLIEQAQRHHPDLILTDIWMPEIDGLDAVAQICRQEPVPVIVISAHSDSESIQRASSEYIFGYLVKPVKKKDLEPAISVAMLRFEQFQSLRKEARDLWQALSDRKLIERAKGILMKRSQLDEETAFRRLQQMARDKNEKLASIAKTLVAAEDLVRQSQQES
ncbi:Response regulator receiver [Planctomycetales bacterium 10988]|nr:Response regulator receiver [Planctomycetales bacterium 10988]